MKVSFRAALGAAGCAFAMALCSGECAAQSAEAGTSGKGIVGGALLGAEAVMLVEAVFDVKPTWAYLVGGAAGAGAGGLAGYYVEQGTGARPTTFLLAGGIALIVPTMIVVMNATRYQPPDSRRDGGQAPLEAGLQAPTFTVREAFTPSERARFRVSRTNEYHLSLLRGAF